MQEAQARVRKFEDEAELEDAIKALWPADPELSLEEYDLRCAEQSLLMEAGRILQTAFGFSEGAVEVVPIKISPGAMLRPTGHADRDHIAIAMATADDPRLFTEITIRGVKECRPNAAAALFAGTLQRALEHALTMAGQGGGQQGAEMLTLALEEATTIAFLKRFIEEPLNPFAEFMVRYVPFRGGFLRAKAIGRWMRRIPGTTYEGAPLRTGLALDTSRRAAGGGDRGRGRAARARTALFKTPIPVAEVFSSKQDLVLADGRSSFLLVRTDMKVHGVVIMPTPIDVEYMERGVSPDMNETPNVDRLWVQSVDHRRLSIYGTIPSGDLIHVADIQNGALRLRDPKADFDLAVATIQSVVDEEARDAVKPLMHAMLARTRAGRGGALVIGQKPRQIDIRRRVEPGFPVRDGGREWQSLLNPDGVALLSPPLEVVAVGGFIKTIAGARTGGAGTRHAAAAKATVGRKNVAIAISDDKTLTLYKGGARIIRIS